MSIFGLYRVLEFPGKVKMNTITDPSAMVPQAISEFSEFVFSHLVKVLKSRHPDDPLVTPLWHEDGETALDFLKTLRAEPFLSSKSGPSIRGGNVPGGAQNTSPAAILASAFAWLNVHRDLYEFVRNWCQMTGNTWVLNRIDM
jgi:hypothetical protein